ncbi:MAG: YIP1 family protein [Rhodobacterales bacterium]|nr:YIP1 family protein [Rhodobacterales bacterium]
MTGLLDQIVRLARQSLEDPRAGARSLLAQGVPLPARTAGLLLMAVSSALLMHAGFLLMPATDDPTAQFMMQSPLRTALIQWLVLVASVFLIYRVGRAWGGTGTLSDTLLVVVWLQVIMLGVQFVQLVALIVAPPLAGIVNLAGLVLFFWLITSFIAVLQGFASRWAVLAGIFGASFAVAVVLVIILSLIFGPEAFQGV